MLTWLKRLTGPRALTRLQSVRRRPAWLRGRYDAATTTDNNARHWRAADGLSANAANSPDGSRIASGSLDGTIRIWDGGPSPKADQAAMP